MNNITIKSSGGFMGLNKSYTVDLDSHPELETKLKALIASGDMKSAAIKDSKMTDGMEYSLTTDSDTFVVHQGSATSTLLKFVDELKKASTKIPLAAKLEIIK